ncbi:hypothetical protein ANOM_010097 [Aspergillus nomiae NRRL 13137]|uniref:Tyrosine-protein kinase catalytic domain-containing protein n=1 Tax=Aspergillus nomiae NRRL (strain ATCC 15546 / NRRL 13137 / CBS 260.88 / M93) TaxID=1509407 RepID=A0A0L1INJ8_ASPN3|nr:uncharacterized protein ANOM_010097 [Aspergillus nomiae NRRL 13137]KNG80905.1 hypothetical protein ANOM_010097 [Aspergillus nomiae NRRL 13137]
MDTKPDLIGLGRVGCGMRIGDIAVKTANTWTVPANASEYTSIVYQQTNRTNEESLIHEGRIYQRLAFVEGVLKPLHISNKEIRMPYIAHGSLDKHLSTNKTSINNEQRLGWFQNAAEIINGVHEQRVIIADIAARNFLINKDLSLQLCEDFLSIKFDIARFGSTMYEIVSGNRYEFYVNPEIDKDLDDDESKTYKDWPTSEQFPDTRNIFLGDIIRKCWLKDGYCSMKEVHTALHSTRASIEAIEATLDWRYIFRVGSPIITTIIFSMIVARRLLWRKVVDTITFKH